MKMIQLIRNWCRGTANLEKLKRAGLHVGEGLFLGTGTFIDPSHCFLIWIGNNVTFSSNVHLIAHDASTKKHIGYTKIGQIHIGNNVFVGANVSILPNVTIGDNAIIGSGSIVTKNVPLNEVWAGNPARRICSVEEYTAKYVNVKRYDKSYRLSDSLSDDKKAEMIKATSDGMALIE